MLANVYYACTAVNIATDWVTALMYAPKSLPQHPNMAKGKLITCNRPIPLLWRVQINRNTKISVLGLMGLGALCVITLNLLISTLADTYSLQCLDLSMRPSQVHCRPYQRDGLPLPRL